MNCDRTNSYIFVNGVEIHKFIGKNSEINAAPPCVRNISKDISVYYDFSVDYDVIAVDNILNIWKFLM